MKLFFNLKSTDEPQRSIKLFDFIRRNQSMDQIFSDKERQQLRLNLIGEIIAQGGGIVISSALRGNLEQVFLTFGWLLASNGELYGQQVTVVVFCWPLKISPRWFALSWPVGWTVGAFTGIERVYPTIYYQSFYLFLRLFFLHFVLFWGPCCSHVSTMQIWSEQKIIHLMIYIFNLGRRSLPHPPLLHHIGRSAIFPDSLVVRSRAAAVSAGASVAIVCLAGGRGPREVLTYDDQRRWWPSCQI